jgi:tetratricopeptide (TPR) repeat protein
MCRHPHRKGDEIAQKVLSLYGVLDDPQWLARVDRAHLSDEQKKQLRDTVYETLIVLADFGPRWKKTAEVAEESLRHLQLAESFHEPTRAFYWVRSECHRLLGNAAVAAADRQRFTERLPRLLLITTFQGTRRWAGDLQEEIRSYEAALAIQPDHFNSLYFLAWRLDTVGRHDESRGVARAVIAVKPDDQDALVSAGGHLLQDGKPAEAAATFRRAIELYPLSQQAYYGLAGALKKLGKDAEAREAFEKVVELSPGRHTLRPRAIRFGRSLELEDGMKRLPPIVRPLNLTRRTPRPTAFGAILSNQGQLGEAIVCVNKVIELDPQNAKVHAVLGAILSNQDQFDEAIAYFKKAIELDPQDTLVHTNLGAGLANQGQLDEAIACYKKVIKLDPKNAAAHNNLAWYPATCPAEEMRDRHGHSPRSKGR